MRSDGEIPDMLWRPVPTWVSAVEQVYHVGATAQQLRGTVQLAVDGIRVRMTLLEGVDA